MALGDYNAFNMTRGLSFVIAIWVSFAPTIASAQTTTPSDAASIVWATVRSICQAEADQFDTFFPGLLEDAIEEELVEEGNFNWPLSAESMQIYSYIIMQSGQVAAVLRYEEYLRNRFEDPNTPNGTSPEQVKAATDFAKCLMPVGVRFSDSEEPGVSQMAHQVTERIICGRWLEYSDRLLLLKPSELSQGEYSRSQSNIYAETVGSCEQN